MNLKLRTAAVTTVEQYILIGVAEMHTPLSSASRSGVPFGRCGTVLIPHWQLAQILLYFHLSAR